MKKFILIFAATVLIMCGTACSENGNLPNDQPQSSAEETASSTDSAPESKSDASDAEISENTSKTALEKFTDMLDGYDCAVAYLGYTETADVNSVRECAAKSLAAAKYPFFSDITDDRIILAGGGDVYCIIPTNTDAKVTVNSLDRDENGAEITGDELFSGDSAPILLSCNVSDIMPNAAVSITNGDTTLKFSPFISLRDGRLSLPENMKILDFSEYEF